MTHFQFGSIIGDPTTETRHATTDGGQAITSPLGVLEAGHVVLLQESATMAIGTQTAGAPPVNRVALELAGRINHSTDTVQATFLMDAADAGDIAGALLAAVRRLGDPDLAETFIQSFDGAARRL